MTGSGVNIQVQIEGQAQSQFGVSGKHMTLNVMNISMVGVENMMARYVETYQSLYKREPSELRHLGGNWLKVNGALMTVDELKHLTDQLQAELFEERNRKRGLVKRLLRFFGAN